MSYDSPMPPSSDSFGDIAERASDKLECLLAAATAVRKDTRRTLPGKQRTLKHSVEEGSNRRQRKGNNRGDGKL